MNETERQIVAWLRKDAGGGGTEEHILEWAAAAIERGEHRDKQDG